MMKYNYYNIYYKIFNIKFWYIIKIKYIKFTIHIKNGIKLSTFGMFHSAYLEKAEKVLYEKEFLFNFYLFMKLNIIEIDI